MQLSKQRLLKQLADSRKAKSLEVSPSFLYPLFRERHSTFPKGTLGHFADQLNRRPEHIIEQFAAAGVRGLTLETRINNDAKAALLEYLREIVRNPPEQILSSPGEIREQLLIAQAVSDDLLRVLSQNPEDLYRLTSRKFEELVARYLEDQGCEVSLTPPTKDGGFDIFAVHRSGPIPVVLLAECKRYAPENPVGIAVIRGLYGVVEAKRANAGLVVTTSSFTRGAREEQIRIGPRMSLQQFEDLKGWLTRYGGRA